MATIQQGKMTFTILDELQNKHPELIKLILATESMDDSERQYWFDILPSMNEDQTKRLYDILETEKKKLEELEVKYQEEIATLNQTHTNEWQAHEMKKQKEAIAAQEAADTTNKQEDAKAVLGNW